MRTIITFIIIGLSSLCFAGNDIDDLNKDNAWLKYLKKQEAAHAPQKVQAQKQGAVARKKAVSAKQIRAVKIQSNKGKEK